MGDASKGFQLEKLLSFQVGGIQLVINRFKPSIELGVFDLTSFGRDLKNLSILISELHPKSWRAK